MSITRPLIAVCVVLLSGLVCGSVLANTLDDCNAPAYQRSLHAASLSVPAQAIWLNRQWIRWPAVSDTGHFRLVYSATGQLRATPGSRLSGADGAIQLLPGEEMVSDAIQTRFKFVAKGVSLKAADADLKKISAIMRQQMLLVQEDSNGILIRITQLQIPGALDDLYAAARNVDNLGVSLNQDVHHPETRFKLWAPTAQAVAVCIYPNGSGPAKKVVAMHSSVDTGVWSAAEPANLTGQYYQYLVDVVVPGAGVIRNRVTDPYSVSLNSDSRRSFITRLDDPSTVPEGWNDARPLATVRRQTDMNVYELHVRDFSINDDTVSPDHRGKYLAFTELHANGMQHLAALAKAGITDVHLLPVFDFASVPEHACKTPRIDPTWDGAGMQQQAAVLASADVDCFNWGYDPYHYNAPEGSYATDPDDGARRIIEFRRMVQALHGIGLRVGMDVVYNHAYASGQQEKSVLDRIVPGYYQRLNADGVVEHSTCCDNTATENLMMGKLLTDSVLQWAQQYQIDSFRFDLMAHQPRALMEALKLALRSRTGRDIQLIGEGWNFGEVADGARFVQASQLSLQGSGIGTFNDRLRDAVRGGGSADSGDALIRRKGYINGAAAPAQTADMIRVGLAGSIQDFALLTFDGKTTLLRNIDYNGQPAGYVSEPGEVVNYVENHDNQTLFDINVYKLPPDTSKLDRVRVQMLGAAIVAFSQGVAYYHAGIDILRSKSLDANSFNSGDWFNRLDWHYRDNYFATGLPPQPDNGKNYALMQPLLANPAIKPGETEIRLSRDLFRDLIRLRSSSSLFHLSSAAEIRQRLQFENVGPDQNAAVMVGHLDGRGYPGAQFGSVLYLINVSATSQKIVLDSEKNKSYVLHPVLSSANAADQRLIHEARYDGKDGTFTLPPYSAVVYVEP